MYLKKIVVQRVKNFLELWEQILCRKMHKSRSQFLIAGPLILQDNARLHIANVVTKKLHDYGWEVLTERGGSVVTHETRIREVPGSNPVAGQPA